VRDVVIRTAVSVKSCFVSIRVCPPSACHGGLVQVRVRTYYNAVNAIFRCPHLLVTSRSPEPPGADALALTLIARQVLTSWASPHWVHNVRRWSLPGTRHGRASAWPRRSIPSATGRSAAEGERHTRRHAERGRDRLDSARSLPALYTSKCPDDPMQQLDLQSTDQRGVGGVSRRFLPPRA
jgi:hypothetical protein